MLGWWRSWGRSLPGLGMSDVAAGRTVASTGCSTSARPGPWSGSPATRGRTAYSIAALLQRSGKRIVPIHPDAPTVLGEQGYATLADVPFPIDVVDVFRRSEAAGEFADQAVAVGAKGVWFQLGVIDEDAFERTARPACRW